MAARVPTKTFDKYIERVTKGRPLNQAQFHHVLKQVKTEKELEALVQYLGELHPQHTAILADDEKWVRAERGWDAKGRWVNRIHGIEHSAGWSMLLEEELHDALDRGEITRKEHEDLLGILEEEENKYGYGE